MSFLVQSPFPIFEGTDGQPLQAGYIYIGTANLNPESNPVPVFWDSALTQPAAQPIRTSGGYPARQGSPGRIYTASNYSIIVKDSKQRLVFSEFSAGIQALSAGMIGGIITDLNFDPTALGMTTNEVRLLTTSTGPANQPATGSGAYYLVTLAKVSSSEYRVIVTSFGAMASIFTRIYAAGVWGEWNANGQSPLGLATGSSPYTLVAGTVPTLLVSSTTNPYIINLPQNSVSTGFAVDIVNTTVLATGLVKIVPFAGDKIGPMPANVAIYLQNVDQAGWQNGKQRVRLMADGLGTWSVNGQWMPEPGSVDAAGSQYYLGRLRRLPLGNTTTRGTFQTIPAASSFGSAIQITGTVGIPTGSKAILCRIRGEVSSVAGGACTLTIAMSDNNSSTPGEFTSHPQYHNSFLASGGGSVLENAYEIIIPLNTSGQFFIYTITSTNVFVATNISFYPIGYFLGD